MRSPQADVHHSASSWRQPCPPAASVERSMLVEGIAKRILNLGQGRLLVGIDGFTAVGKTSFGHELAEWISAAGRPVLRATLISSACSASRAARTAEPRLFARFPGRVRAAGVLRVASTAVWAGCGVWW